LQRAGGKTASFLRKEFSMSLSEVPVLSASPSMHKSHKSSKSVDTICGHTIPKHPQDQGAGYPITSVSMVLSTCLSWICLIRDQDFQARGFVPRGSTLHAHGES
jgi:hypothetical protein